MGKRRRDEGRGGGEDQYGETCKSQDREQFNGPTGRGGFAGGGSAGGSIKGRDISFQFQKQVPKFLQKYSHLLGKGRQNEEEPTVDSPGKARNGDDDEDEDEYDDQGENEAIQRALAENPELAAQVGDKYLNKMQAQEEKDKGNKAFADNKFDVAITHFSKAIELEPTSEVFFSNRSAAYASLARYEEALLDALDVVRLKPGWVKGHARVAAAQLGLQRYSEAREAYEAALKIEPEDQSLMRGLEKALSHEAQQVAQRKHTFKKALPAQGGPRRERTGERAGKEAGKSGQAKKAVLSFGDEEEEEGA